MTKLVKYSSMYTLSLLRILNIGKVYAECEKNVQTKNVHHCTVFLHTSPSLEFLPTLSSPVICLKSSSFYFVSSTLLFLLLLSDLTLYSHSHLSTVIPYNVIYLLIYVYMYLSISISSCTHAYMSLNIDSMHKRKYDFLCVFGFFT